MTINRIETTKLECQAAWQLLDEMMEIGSDADLMDAHYLMMDAQTAFVNEVRDALALTRAQLDVSLKLNWTVEEHYLFEAVQSATRGYAKYPLQRFDLTIDAVDVGRNAHISVRARTHMQHLLQILVGEATELLA